MEITVKKPTKDELDALRISSWSTWECEPSTFDWTYSDKETAYLFEGRVTVTTAQGRVSFGAGDLVVIGFSPQTVESDETGLIVIHQVPGNAAPITSG